jgi:Ca-activated chloride channel family protein
MKYLLVIISLISCIALHAQDSNIYVSRGNQYYQLSQFDAAEGQYRKALEMDPNNNTAQYNLANALQKQKKYDEAIQVLEQLTSSTNNKTIKSSSYYNQGVAYTKSKNLEASIEAYKNALRLNPADQEARENLQKALLELKKQQQQKKNQEKQNQQPKMNQKEAEQKLKLLQQKERNIQQRLQNQSNQSGSGQSQDW